MKLIASIWIASISVAAVSGVTWAIRQPSAPIMTCDPTTLKKGMTESEVIALCGKPNDENRTIKPWYPFHGETRANMSTDAQLIYGSIWSKDRNVNLYIRGGKLDSVQIFGDYK